MSAATSNLDDEKFMREALAEARVAWGRGEVPVGAVVVVDGHIVGQGHNRREELQDPTAHAELLALREAAHKLGHWRLSGASLYSTLEPCPMCAGALILARVDRLVYGAEDPKAGAAGTLWDIVRDPRLNHRLDVTRGVLAEEAGELLSRFFTSLRAGAEE